MSYAIQRVVDGRYLQMDKTGEHWVNHATDASTCSDRQIALLHCQPGEQVVTLPDTRDLLSKPREVAPK